MYWVETKFENYYISNNRQPTTNYKSIHFIMGGKELTEEELQKFTFKGPNHEIIQKFTLKGPNHETMKYFI